MQKEMQKVFEVLDSLNIDYTTVFHNAVYTISGVADLDLPHAELIAKNLFICDDKKYSYYLIVVGKEKRVDLKKLKQSLQSRRLSLVPENDLQAILGLSGGSVSPFGILNDSERKVRVLIDDTFKERRIGVHPNDNTATIWLQTTDLIRVIEQHGNALEFIGL